MFVRAKTIKGQKYAYLVKNTWVKGKVKQTTKKYLGKIFDLNSFFDPSVVRCEVDFSDSLENIFRSLIVRELESFGFVFDGKRKLVHDSGLIVKLNKKSTFIFSNKPIVLFFNNRYVYPKLFDLLLSFYEPETDNDKRGEKLAFRLRDAGINISQEEFVSLYKKIYLSDQRTSFVRKGDFDY